MDVALLAASLAILVWMCLQVALLARESRRVIEVEAPSAPAATRRPPPPLAVTDQAPALD